MTGSFGTAEPLQKKKPRSQLRGFCFSAMGADYLSADITMRPRISTVSEYLSV